MSCEREYLKKINKYIISLSPSYNLDVIVAGSILYFRHYVESMYIDHRYIFRISLLEYNFEDHLDLRKYTILYYSILYYTIMLLLLLLLYILYYTVMLLLYYIYYTILYYSILFYSLLNYN